MKGIGLIERKRRSHSNPDLIYVKNFTSIPCENEESESEKMQQISGFEQNCNFQNSKIRIQKCRILKLRVLHIRMLILRILKRRMLEIRMLK